MTTSDVIAIAAVVVAICAMLGTFWQGHLARQHNRLIVKPFLTLHTERIRNNDAYHYVATLKNSGVGPALVFDRYFTVKSKKYTAIGPDANALAEVLQQVLGSKCKWQLHKNGLPGQGSAMLPNAEQVLAHVVFPGATEPDYEGLERMLSSIDINVGYRCLYGQVFWLRSDNHRPLHES